MSRNPEAAARIIHHLETGLAQAMSSMTGKQITVTAEKTAESPRFEAPSIWQQSYSCSEDPVFWLVADRDFWLATGRLTLEAAGIDDASEEDCRSTWHEILGQTMGAIASGLTADVQSEITAAKGSEITAEPKEMPWIPFAARDGEAAVWYFKAAWTSELTAIFGAAEQAPRSPLSRDSSVSKTFDLLLDVALPVSVSFGKTSLQIREVLKLNTGSIVELDRFVVEPVDVIVNDCVIARGEVVVVDGNYGVRITQLASREDRLRSGMPHTAARAAHR